MKKIVNIIMTFFLVIFVLGFIVLTITKNTILSENYILGKLENMNYYSKVVDNVKDSFKINILQSGLDENVIEEIVDETKIKNDINGFIHSIYTSVPYDIETQSIIDKLNVKIDEKLNSTGKIMTEENKIAIQNFLDAISNAYVNEIMFINGLDNIATNVLSKLTEVFALVDKVLIAGMVVFALMLLLINRNVNFLIITLFTNALLLIFVNLFVNYNIQIDNVLMFTESFSEAVRIVGNDYMSIYLKIGAGFGILALIMQLVYGMIKKEEE